MPGQLDLGVRSEANFDAMNLLQCLKHMHAYQNTSHSLLYACMLLSLRLEARMYPRRKQAAWVRATRRATKRASRLD